MNSNTYTAGGIERLIAIATRADLIHDLIHELKIEARSARALASLEADRRRDAERRLATAQALADRWEHEDRMGDRGPLSKTAAAHALTEAMETTR